MKIKNSTVVLLAILMILCFTSCEKNEKLDKAPVSMKWAEQMDGKEYVHFKMQIPENWILIPYYVFGVNGWEASVSETTMAKEEYGIHPQKFYVFGYFREPEYEERYEKLFAGDYAAYEATLSYDYTEIFDDMVGLEILKQDFREERNYKKYRGKNGDITQVEVLVYDKENNLLSHEITCYREDIPYAVQGIIDDSVPLCSGEIVPYIASTLEVDERFFIKNGITYKTS